MGRGHEQPYTQILDTSTQPIHQLDISGSYRPHLSCIYDTHNIQIADLLKLANYCNVIHLTLAKRYGNTFVNAAAALISTYRAVLLLLDVEYVGGAGL